MTSRKSGADTAAPVTESEDSQLTSLDSAVFSGVNVRLDARLGAITLTVERLLALKTGETVALDSRLNDLVELQINGATVGRGEIVAVGDHFAVRIVEIATAA